jgi:cysteine desulfurase
VNGDPSARIPNTTNIAFARLEAEAILLLLSEQNICASAGAACASGSLEPSHVLRAMKIEDKIAHGAIRFSLSRYTTDAEIDRALRSQCERFHIRPACVYREMR